MRDKEWLFKAREAILREFYRVLNLSNGMEIVGPEEGSVYKYFLGRGNNACIVKQVFAGRWWWSRVDVEEMADANFVWT